MLLMIAMSGQSGVGNTVDAAVLATFYARRSRGAMGPETLISHSLPRTPWAYLSGKAAKEVYRPHSK